MQAFDLQTKSEDIDTQNVRLKTGPLARRNQESILFRLVFGRINERSYRRCWKLDPCGSIHICARVIKNPFLTSLCRHTGFKWNIV
jgi:hypothetical protein